MGLVSPLYLEEKLIFQSLHSLDLSWDDPLPPLITMRWNSWKEAMKDREVQIPRCFVPEGFVVESASLDNFSDASDVGYAQCSYLRFVSKENFIHCYLIFGKSRVTPSKPNISLPRLELMAATLSAMVASFLREELDIHYKDEHFWCDSEVVLGYIKNFTKRFKLFVTNIVNYINSVSNPSKWHYVSSKDNPADVCTRGVKSSSSSFPLWIKGPEFLWNDFNARLEDRTFLVEENCSELKKELKVNVLSLVNGEDSLLSVLENISDFGRMKGVFGYLTWINFRECRL